MSSPIQSPELINPISVAQNADDEEEEQRLPIPQDEGIIAVASNTQSIKPLSIDSIQVQGSSGT